jgi:hypothetical protein
MRNGYKIFVGKPEKKRPLEIPGRRWEDNIKIYVMEIEWEGVDWIHPAQNSEQWRDLTKTVMKLRVL